MSSQGVKHWNDGLKHMELAISQDSPFVSTFSEKELDDEYDKLFKGLKKGWKRQRQQRKQQAAFEAARREALGDDNLRRSKRIKHQPRTQVPVVAPSHVRAMLRVSLGEPEKGNLCFVVTCPANVNIKRFMLDEIGYCHEVFSFNENQARVPLHLGNYLRELGLDVPNIPKSDIFSAPKVGLIVPKVGLAVMRAPNSRSRRSRN